MDKIEELKEQMAIIFDKAEDKDMVATLTKINVTIDEISAAQQALKNENKELLDSYKEMIKHTSITPNASQKVSVTTNSDLTFDDFLASYKPSNK